MSDGYYEYQEMIAFAVANGKTREEAHRDWRLVGAIQPIYCNIIYPCDCDENSL